MKYDEQIAIIVKIIALRRDDSLSDLSLTTDDAKQIAQTATQQGVATWTLWRVRQDYAQCANLQQLAAELRNYAIAVAVSNEHTKNVFFKIAHKLETEGITVVAMKGVAMMLAHYPEIAMRQVGDIDIWVDHSDVYRAHEIISEFDPMFAHGNHRRTKILSETVKTHLPSFTIDGLHVELHFNFYSAYNDKNPQVILSEHIAEHNYQNEIVRTFDAPTLLYHQTTHLAKSRRVVSGRLNWALDIAVLMENFGDDMVDFCEQAIAVNKLNKSELIEYWQYCASLLPKEKSNILCRAFNITEQPIDAKFLRCLHQSNRFSPKRLSRAAIFMARYAYHEVSNIQDFTSKLKYIRDILHDLTVRNIT